DCGWRAAWLARPDASPARRQKRAFSLEARYIPIRMSSRLSGLNLMVLASAMQFLLPPDRALQRPVWRRSLPLGLSHLSRRARRSYPYRTPSLVRSAGYVSARLGMSASGIDRGSPYTRQLMIPVDSPR